jgi:hypothetical protein
MKIKLFLIGVAALVLAAGCASQSGTAYKTLDATIIGVHAGYDTYLNLVVDGKLTTNSVPKVSVAYNVFQNAANAAVIASADSLTNIPPADIQALATDVLSAITTAEGK